MCLLCNREIHVASVVFHIPTCYIKFCLEHGFTPQCTCPEHLGRYSHFTPSSHRLSYQDIAVIMGNSPVVNPRHPRPSSIPHNSGETQSTPVASQLTLIPGLTTSNSILSMN